MHNWICSQPPRRLHPLLAPCMWICSIPTNMHESVTTNMHESVMTINRVELPCIVNMHMYIHSWISHAENQVRPVQRYRSTLLLLLSWVLHTRTPPPSHAPLTPSLERSTLTSNLTRRREKRWRLDPCTRYACIHVHVHLSPLLRYTDG